MEPPERRRCPQCGRDLETLATACALCGAAFPPRAIGGKWTLERKLGQGGMGAVYLAWETELQRKVAIKMLSDELCEDPELVARFEREARMMARLDHPNLVPIYAVGHEGRVPFIVMKALQGTTLGEQLKSRGRLPLKEVFAIAAQLCAGLEFMHANGVIHRDLKPANVFVGPTGHVTLLDLGVARDSTSGLTKSGMVLGTPRYMAPEQITGGALDHRADLYALATVVYEMMTGAAPFASGSDYAALMAHLQQPPPNLLSTPGIPAGLAELITKGLSKLPGERFQSAHDFAQALERVARSADVTPMLDAPLPGITGAMTAALPAPVSSSGYDVLPPTTPSRPRPPPRTRRWALIAGAVACCLAGVGWQLSPLLRSKPPVTVQSAAPIPKPLPPPDPQPLPDVNPEVTVSPVEPAKPKPAAPAKTGPAELRCVTTTSGESSWAYVDVDGLRRGTTPLSLKVPAGDHALTFRRPGFKTMQRKINVSPGENRLVAVELTP